ncbi:hypothetical protein TrST_g13205 [Triparma strigata]|uniref:Uncharacterized protein n=1 Tax=Triparma strigata TaxID=1606541 RepID=A0A9W7EMJ8_9STRA|nr:hypothetical protein TrST_g13205 [Triparma strigata]
MATFLDSTNNTLKCFAKINRVRRQCEAIAKTPVVDRNVLGQHRFESFVSTSHTAAVAWKGGDGDDDDWSEGEEEGEKGSEKQLYPDHTLFHTVEVLLHLIGEEASVEPLDPLEHQPVPVDGKRGPPYMKTMTVQKNRAGEASGSILLGSCNKIAAFLDLVLDHHHPDIDVKSMDNYYLKPSFTGYRVIRLKVKYREEVDGEIMVHLLPLYKHSADHDEVEDFFGGGESFNENMESVLSRIFGSDRVSEDEEVVNMILKRDEEGKLTNYNEFSEENSIFVKLLKEGSDNVLEALKDLTGKNLLNDTMAFLAVVKQCLEVALTQDDDDEVLNLQFELGVAYQLNSMHTDAVQAITLALDGFEALGHERTIEAMVSLSSSHLVLEQIHEAVELLNGALETQSQLTGENSEEAKNIAELLNQAVLLSLTDEERADYEEERIAAKRTEVMREDDEEEPSQATKEENQEACGGRYSPSGRLSPSSPTPYGPLTRTKRAAMRKENAALQEENDLMREEILRLTHEVEKTQKTIRGVYLWGASGSQTEEVKT